MTTSKEYALSSQFPLLLCAVVPLLIIPGMRESYLLPKILATALLAFIAAGFGLRKAWSHKDQRVGTGLDLPMGAFLIAAIVSAGYSVDAWPNWAGPYAVYSYGILLWILCAEVFYLASFERDGDFPKQLIVWFVAASIPVSIYALLQWTGWDPYRISAFIVSFRSEHRPVSSIGGSVSLGSYLMMVVPLACYLALEKRSRYKAIGVVGLCVGVAALIVTHTRSAWLGALAGVWVFAWLGGALSRKNLRILLALSLLCGAGLLALRGSRAVADAERMQIWRTAIDTFKAHPLLGIGPGAFGVGMRLYGGQQFVEAANSAVTTHYDAHNDWLQVLCTMGLVGIMIYIWAHVMVVNEIRAMIMAGRMRAEAAAIMGTLTSVWVQAKASTLSCIVLILAFLLAGCVFGGRRSAPQWSGRAMILGLASLAFVMVLACADLCWADLQAGWGVLARAKGLPRDAAAHFEQAVTWNPYETSYRLLLNNLLWDVASDAKDRKIQGDLLHRATQVAFEGVQRRPGDYLPYQLLGKSEMKRFELAGENRLDYARRAFDLASRLNPTLLWIEEDRAHLDELSRLGR